jgi:hypothetical protein
MSFAFQIEVVIGTEKPERSLRNISPGSRGSLRLDVGRANDLGPFLGFSRDMFSKPGWRIGKHDGAQVGKPRCCFGIGQDRTDLLVEAVNDLGGGVLWRADAGPSACLVARHEFADRRQVG